MDVDFNKKNLLYTQVKENYGRVIYSYTSQMKMVEILSKRSGAFKILQIVISALSGSALFSLIFASSKHVAIIGTILSIVLVIISSISRTFMFQERINMHQKAHDSYWLIKEEYISLVTDFDLLEDSEIRKKRDELIMRTDFINKTYPKTTKKAYEMAKKALIEEEEQTFNPGEIDNMLPQKQLKK